MLTISVKKELLEQTVTSLEDIQSRQISHSPLDVEARVWKNSCVDREMNGRLVRVQLFCCKSS